MIQLIAWVLWTIIGGALQVSFLHLVTAGGGELSVIARLFGVAVGLWAFATGVLFGVAIESSRRMRDEARATLKEARGE